MVKHLTPLLLSITLLGTAYAQEGVPIHAALADKPTPLPSYVLPAEEVVDLGYKHVEPPMRRTGNVVVLSGERFRSAFPRFYEPVGGEVVLSLDPLHGANGPL
jgi:hypothetical protein